MARLHGRLALFASLLLLPGCARASAKAIQGGVLAGVPPVEARTPNGPSYLLKSSFQAESGVSCEEKSVSFYWSYSPSGDFVEPDLYEKQVVATSFWPTVIEVVNEDQVLVGGKDRDGDTRLERWTIQVPLIASTELGEHLVPQPPADMTVIYEESTPGRDIAHFLLDVQGAEGKAFVQFFDSGDLWSIDYADEPYAMTLVLDTTQQPALADAYSEAWRARHLTLGDVYVFETPDKPGSLPFLVLVDQDENGTIDSSTALPWLDYANLGMCAYESYSSIRGRPVAP